MKHRHTLGSGKRFAACVIPLLLAFGSGCSSEFDDSTTDDSEQTEDLADELSTPGSPCQGSIGAVPANVNPYFTHATFTKYFYMPTYKIHFFGTAEVGNDAIMATCALVKNMVASFESSADRSKMAGHKVHLATYKSPALPGTSPPQRNGGNHDGTLLSVEFICRKDPVDPLYSGGDRRYRGWDTPVHEIGHSIEFRLGREAQSNQVFSKEPGYQKDYAREYFAWATQSWFSADVHNNSTRSTMSPAQKSYMSTIFKPGATWVPKCQ